MRDRDKVLQEFNRLRDDIKSYGCHGFCEGVDNGYYSSMWSILTTLAWVLEYEGDDKLLCVYGKRENVVY